MQKAGEITPWSFYRNQLTSQIIQGQIQSSSNLKTNASSKQTLELKKNFHKINLEHVNSLSSGLQRAPPKSSIQMYCSIISTSSQMIQTRDQTISLNNRLTLLIAIKQSLKKDNLAQKVTRTKQKYECLFPILKPRQSLQLKKYKILKNQFKSDYFGHKIVGINLDLL